jgi:hypothetical protein
MHEQNLNAVELTFSEQNCLFANVAFIRCNQLDGFNPKEA